MLLQPFQSRRNPKIEIDIDLRESYIPTQRQAEAHKAAVRYILYGGAMGGGKSVWGSMEGLRLSLNFPGNVGLLCRWELEALKRTTLRTFLEFCPSGLIKRHNKADKTIELINGSLIMYFGLKPSSTFNAFERLKSLDLGWFFIDECTEIPKALFDLLKTRLRLSLPGGGFPRYRGLMACNPEPGWVRETFIDQSLPDHLFVPALPNENPHLPPGYIEQMIQDLPPELVEKYIKGSWDVIVGNDYIFPYSLIKAAMDRELQESMPVEAGVDVARFGGDSNVVAIRWGPVVRIAYESFFQDTMKTTGEVGIVLDEEKPQISKVDSVGVGAGLHDRLWELNYKVCEVVGGSAPRNKEKFLNARAENHWGFRERLESSNADLPDDPRVLSQLAGIKYTIQSDRRIKVESKEDMKKRGLKSPNLADAIIMAFAVGYAQEVYAASTHQSYEQLGIR